MNRTFLISYSHRGGFGRAFMTLQPGQKMDQAAVEAFEQEIRANGDVGGSIVVIAVSEMES